MIAKGMDQVKKLRLMVSETKQNLIDQKRLQYLENLYRDKIQKDEMEEIQPDRSANQEKGRRLQSATYNSSYADHIASKYRLNTRGASAYGG